MSKLTFFAAFFEKMGLRNEKKCTFAARYKVDN